MGKRHDKLGFKQTIQKHWMDKTLRMLLAGQAEGEIRAELGAYLSTQKQSGGVGERGPKTYGMAIALLAAWFAPEEELRDFCGDCLRLARETPQDGWLPMHWAVLSAAYPFLGYQKRMIRVNGDPALAKDGIAAALKARGYVQEEAEDGVLQFHLSSPVNRAARLWEDRITLAPVLGGFQVEGLSRDLVRVVGAIEHHFRNHGND